MQLEDGKAYLDSDEILAGNSTCRSPADGCVRSAMPDADSRPGEDLPVHPQGEDVVLRRTGDVDVDGEVAFFEQDQDSFTDRLGIKAQLPSEPLQAGGQALFGIVGVWLEQADDLLLGAVVQASPAMLVLLRSLLG